MKAKLGLMETQSDYELALQLELIERTTEAVKSHDARRAGANCPVS